ncbi:MAG: CDP-alcohol phosphatidyltransferase family protein [Anaerolineae bacterium]|nr:CDP-alcohol phosphatidyltransferase family protein [Anaerolineae bacterium]
MNLANLITTLRFPLLVIIVLLLYFGSAVGQVTAAVLIIALILMDSLDGIIARRRDEQTLIGSALDVAADRAVEIVLWVAYAHLRLIPIFIPLAVIIRGALTDSIRNVALQHGESAHSMMRAPWARWLVASGVMRTGYAVIKAVAFTVLALALGLRSGQLAAWHSFWMAGLVFSWLALALCLLRGLPVIVEAPALFRSAKFHLPAPSTSVDSPAH